MVQWSNGVVVLLALLSSLAAHAEIRTWEDRSGYTMDAELASTDGKRLVLRKPDGKTKTMQVAKLSAKDQEFIRQHMAPQLQQAKEFVGKLMACETLAEARAFLESDDAKPFITTNAIPRIEGFLASKPNPSTNCIPAISASSRGMGGCVTMEGIWSRDTRFGVPLQTATFSGSLNESSWRGECFVDLGGSKIRLTTELKDDLIPVRKKDSGFMGLSIPEPIVPLAIGSIHRFKDETKLNDYTFNSGDDPLNRLTFVLTDKGYVYLRGRGTVETPSGQVLAFPPETTMGMGKGGAEK